MSQPLTLTGAHINFFINEKLYKVAQNVTLEVDYGEYAIFGIDSSWAQDIAGGQASVKGSVKGLRLKYSGGLQADNIRPSVTDLAASPYITIRIQDRSTGEDIALIMHAKCSRESHVMSTKGSYKLNFDFIGKMVLFALDRA